MVEKLKQYPVTALTVVAMVLITLLLGDLAWFRKLAVVLLKVLRVEDSPGS